MKHQLKMLACIGCCLGALVAGGCHRSSSVVDTLGTEIGDPSFYLWNHDVRELAPVIVVAVVEENRIVARHVEAARYQGVFLDLHQVRCRRENTLKGGLTEAQLKFLYFADGRYPESKPDPKFKRLFRAEPGKRYLFFLTREHDALRSIGDVGDYSIGVWTGQHPDSPNEQQDVGRLISEILLTPGRGADVERMGESLFQYSRIADTWSSSLVTVRLLRLLLALGEPLRSRACGSLVTLYYGQQDCLEAIARDSSESADSRQAAAQQLGEVLKLRPRLLESLRDPAALTYLNTNDDSRRRVRAAFEAMLLGSDPELHRLVCGALKRYYPLDIEPGCPKE